MSENKLNLILDLDETLIFTITTDLYFDDFRIKELPFYKTSFIIENTKYHLFLRHDVNEIIEKLSLMYNLYIFTNSSKKYCDKIIDILNIKDKIIKINTRENKKNFNSFKDLKSFDIDFDLENTFILDDRIIVWEKQYHEIILKIEPFYYDGFSFYNTYSLYKFYDILEKKYLTKTKNNI